MERMRQGDLDFAVKLRRKDHLQEVAAEMNRLMGWLRTRLPAAHPAAQASSTAPDEADERQVVGASELP